MNQSTTITKISAALLKAQREMGNAVKDAKNPFYKSSYADLNSIREAVLPALNNNGIGVFQPMLIKDGRTIIETVLLHESGEFISSETPVVVAKLNDPQAEGSGQSYARRYGLQSLLNVGAIDDDGNAAANRKATPAVVSPLVSAAPTNSVSTTTPTQAVLPAQTLAAETKGPVTATQTAPKSRTTFRKPSAAKAADAKTPAEDGWN